jgi:hypothetical protein
LNCSITRASAQPLVDSAVVFTPSFPRADLRRWSCADYVTGGFGNILPVTSSANRGGSRDAGYPLAAAGITDRAP